METTKTIRRCGCGKRISQNAGTAWCRTCYAARRERFLAEARAIVATGRCPTCGRPLRRNNSLSGWWQCSQHGAEQFRAEPSAPPCEYECFTE